MYYIILGFLIGLTFTMPIGPASATMINYTLQNKYVQIIKFIIGILISNVFFALLFGLLSEQIIGLKIFGIYFIQYLYVLGTIVILWLAYKILTITKTNETSIGLKEGFLISITSPFDWGWWTTVYTTQIISLTTTNKILFATGIVTATIIWLSLLSVTTKLLGQKISILKEIIKYTSAMFLLVFACWMIYGLIIML